MDSPLLQLAVAAALGMLVGLQRERVSSAMAGVRTFTLLTLAGALCAILTPMLGEWLILVGMLGVIAMIVMSNLISLLTEDKPDPGMTTETAAIVMFLIGALVVVGPMAGAVVCTGAIALLLHLKDPLHKTVRRIGEKEIRAVMQFVLIALVILPVLPDKTYGPLNVLNPYKIWLMVVLILGISLAAYAAVKILGSRVGALLAGVLGGLISSTATTVSYARKSREAPEASRLAAAIVLVASTVVFVRIIAEAAIVAPGVIGRLAPPLLTVAAMMGLLGAVSFLVAHRTAPAIPLEGEPSELKTAIVFGALYAVILFVVALVKERFGDAGLYVVAAVSGLTDMDAITLSTANLIKDQRLEASTGWRIILVAAMANIVFKGGMVMMLGSPALRRQVALCFGLVLLGAGAVLVFWP
jgi:uncharacterized membrane protein (DUF4010 family)